MKAEVTHKTEVISNEGIFVKKRIVGHPTISIEIEDGDEKFTSELWLLISKYQNKKKSASEILRDFKGLEAQKRALKQ